MRKFLTFELTKNNEGMKVMSSIPTELSMDQLMTKLSSDAKLGVICQDTQVQKEISKRTIFILIEAEFQEVLVNTEFREKNKKYIKTLIVYLCEFWYQNVL